MVYGLILASLIRALARRPNRFHSIPGNHSGIHFTAYNIKYRVPHNQYEAERTERKEVYQDAARELRRILGVHGTINEVDIWIIQ